MPLALYLSHPEVALDPSVPVPEWGLSDRGRARTEAFAARSDLPPIGRIVASEERKAIETGAILAEMLSLAVDIRPDLHENDRSATGFLPPAEFEATANRFFAAPETSIRGWERAIDAQNRIRRAVADALSKSRPLPAVTLFVGHGGVGTLLMSFCAGFAIDRRHDQMPGGGNWFAFDAATFRLVSPWQRMESDFSAISGRAPG